MEYFDKSVYYEIQQLLLILLYYNNCNNNDRWSLKQHVSTEYVTLRFSSSVVITVFADSACHHAV